MKAINIKKNNIFKKALIIYNKKLKEGYSSDYAKSTSINYVFNETYTKTFSPLLNDVDARKLSDKICKEFTTTNFIAVKTKHNNKQSKINRDILNKPLAPEIQLYVDKMIRAL